MIRLLIKTNQIRDGRGGALIIDTSYRQVVCSGQHFDGVARSVGTAMVRIKNR